MAMSVVYTNFLGGIVAENRGGTHSVYVADNLGSTVALMNSSGAVTDAWTYWPYGAVQARTGTNPTPFAFLGVRGYFQDLLNRMSYVRRRFLRVALVGWQTLDPLWPRQRAYQYALANPIANTDPWGLDVVTSGSPPAQRLQAAMGGDCNTINQFLGGTIDMGAFSECVGAGGCPPVTTLKLNCMQKMCTGQIPVRLRDDSQEYGCIGNCGYNENGVITVCSRACGHSHDCDHFMAGAPYHIVLLHELLHICGVDHPEDAPGDKRCNNVIACCMLRSAGHLLPSQRCHALPG